MTVKQYDRIRDTAAEFGQEHLFQYWETLSDDQRSLLLDDVARIDFPTLARLIGEDQGDAASIDESKIDAPPVYPHEPTGPQVQMYADALQIGESMLSDGKVGTMVVAGGQGTRLGFDAPKGTFPISPIKNKTLFQLFAENIQNVNRTYGCQMPWYVMTSSATDAPTRTFFEEHSFFGLNRADVFFFEQGVMPAVDDAGKIILSQPHRVALSPNGHGGSLLALRDKGVLEDAKRRGVEVLSYFQVDNPLVSPADPLFIGLHKQSDSQMSSIAVPKADDLEKVGNFVSVDGKVQIIEYSDLPDTLAHARNPDGSRKLNAGSVAIHLINRAYVEDLTDGSGISLPWHRASKKVEYFDAKTSTIIKPDAPNATKFEMFIFDAIPLATRSIVLEQLREACFSPVKNAEGVDSANTARRDMIRRAANWLEKSGINIPRDASNEPAATIEISPLRAINAIQFKASLDATTKINSNDEVYLD
ncbi:MAG: UDP-N-acetylhexosamine pyrophosphorylase [Phycisphaerae bacterium]|nr:MAG: UDP-N-acetylhexosamine pyrophosphorylase [Phycisphaerae bacterium]